MILFLLPALLGAPVSGCPHVQPGPAAEVWSEPAALAEGVDELVGRARQLLGEDQPEAAAELFAEAVLLEDSERTRPWLLRAWIAAGRLEDALAAIEEYEAAGAPQASADYLYGMAFHGLALRAAAAGDGAAAMLFPDAVRYLLAASEAADPRFPDVHYALAEAAWYAQDLDVARAAVARALETGLRPAATQALEGRIALSRYKVAADEGAAERASEELARAAAAFDAAIAATPAPESPEESAALAELWLQRAYASLYAEDAEGAARGLREVAAWDPAVLDFGYARGVLAGDLFLEELRAARELYAERHAAHERGDALISWWLGLALYEKNSRADRAAAEVEFLRAVERNPEYASSWYYIALARYTQQDLAGAYAALSTFAQSAPEELASWLAADPAFTGPLLEGLVGWTLGGDPAAPGNAGAAFLCGLLTQVFPEEARHWNNLGLFLRDQGDAELRRPEAERELDVAALYERSLAAYERALELDPANPNYLNDTAVVLHYNLKRDFARARSLYEAARDRASEALAREDLAKDLRELYELALRDANDNLAKLARESETSPSR